MKRVFFFALALAACKSATPSAAPAPSASANASASPRPAHSGPKKDHAQGEASVVVPGGGETLGVTAMSPQIVGLPPVDFGPSGAIDIKGYPEPLETGMRDYATSIGWTKDGDDVLACGDMTPLGPAKGAEPADTCYSRKRGATSTTRSGVEGGDPPHATPALLADLALLKGAVRSDPRRDDPNMKLLPAPLKGTWAYAKDLVLAVDAKDGGLLRIGGSVRGQDPVFPITMSVKTKTPDVVYAGAWNAIVASPDSKEIAFIGHFYCMEWCNDVVITRLTTGALASHVYNDTAFRLHQKKDFAGSRDLFLKATWADPYAPLPPYNLACAYAQLGDETNAEKALKLAIAVGGEKVRARAKKDADFAKVHTAKWFVALAG